MIEEKIFSFPIIGALSLKQMAMLGIGFMVTWGMYQKTSELFSIIPIAILGILALTNQNVLPTERLIISIISYLIRGGHADPLINEEKRKKTINKLSKKEKSKSRSEVLQGSAEFEFDGSQTKEIKTREYYGELNKPIRISMNLNTPTGEPIRQKLATVLFDGNIERQIITDNYGRIEAEITPTEYGLKKLEVTIDGFSKPVYEQLIDIKEIFTAE